MPFHLQIDGEGDGPANMATDALLLAEAEEGAYAARVYSWSGIWVSLGRFQRASKDLFELDTTKWVLRPTGGKAVLHGHDVTVSLAMPLADSRLASRSLRTNYRVITQPLIGALRECGLAAHLAEDTQFSLRGQRTADCFGFNSPNDVVDENTGRKLCGVALRQTDRAILLQASIPFRIPDVDPASLIVGAGPCLAEPWNHLNFAAAYDKALRRFDHS